MIKIGTVCSGIGSPEVAINQLSKELKFEIENVFACDIDKYARASYLANFETEKMFTDMTSEDFHNNSGYSDIFIGGIPCQAFSLAGKRLGELDKRGLLFYDFYRYVKEKQPKIFIIENVKGLLSDNKGKTFQNWLLLLGRSVNQHEQMFLHPDSLEYNLHHTILNSKNFGVPQNRERVFIIGIRKDLPNNFSFPAGWRLDKKLKDILEKKVDEKYYLSDKMLNYINTTNFNQDKKLIQKTDLCSTLLSTDYKSPKCVEVIGEVTPNSQAGKVFNSDGLFPTLTAGTHGYALGYINEPKFLNGSDIGNTIRTGGRGSLTAKHSWDAIIEPKVVCFGRSDEEKKRRAEHFKKFGTDSGSFKDRELIIKDQPYYDTLLANPNPQKEGLIAITDKEKKFKIRRLTPLECWRLQAFPDDNFYKAKEVNSDTQLYKQAGNSMTSSVMKAIIKNTLPILL
jgi:DNA (cytosine-5)-methyltransferase 1